MAKVTQKAERGRQGGVEPTKQTKTVLSTLILWFLILPISHWLAGKPTKPFSVPSPAIILICQLLSLVYHCFGFVCLSVHLSVGFLPKGILQIARIVLLSNWTHSPNYCLPRTHFSKTEQVSSRLWKQGRASYCSIITENNVQQAEKSLQSYIMGKGLGSNPCCDNWGRASHTCLCFHLWKFCIQADISISQTNLCCGAQTQTKEVFLLKNS